MFINIVRCSIPHSTRRYPIHPIPSTYSPSQTCYFLNCINLAYIYTYMWFMGMGKGCVGLCIDHKECIVGLQGFDIIMFRPCRVLSQMHQLSNQNIILRTMMIPILQSETPNIRVWNWRKDFDIITRYQMSNSRLSNSSSKAS